MTREVHMKAQATCITNTKSTEESHLNIGTQQNDNSCCKDETANIRKAGEHIISTPQRSVNTFC